MDRAKFKELYKTKFHGHTPMTFGLLAHAADTIPDGEEILAISNFLECRKSTGSKIGEGIITITNKNCYITASGGILTMLFSSDEILPLDRIISVEIHSDLIAGLTIATYNTEYHFKSAMRAEIVQKALQERISGGQTAKQTDCADEIMKFKKLLDAGAITQEEYEAKKKQLLNI